MRLKPQVTSPAYPTHSLINLAVLHYTGCVVTADDFSRICVAASCYAAQLGCGSVTASLGLCIPFYAAKFDVACTDLGILLTLSGMGYFVGVSIISKMLDPQDRWHLPVSRFVLLCASAFIAGTVAFTLYTAGSLVLVKILIFTQVRSTRYMILLFLYSNCYHCSLLVSAASMSSARWHCPKCGASEFRYCCFLGITLGV